MTRPPTDRQVPAEPAAVLTIGQLAAHVGVTIRAIRHYHQRGLLAEPPRDSSGYRRYDAQAAADLIRIKTLADAGVPLDRIRELLESDSTEFAAAVAQIDQALHERIGDLQQLREQLAGLTAGERLVLPAEVAHLLDQVRSLGISERTLTLERDGWTLLMARLPNQAAEWAADKSACLADPDFRRLYVAWDQAYDWDPADPRLVELATEAAAWLAKKPPTPPPPKDDDDISAVYLLLAAQVGTSSPAWRRLEDLSSAQLQSSQQTQAADPKRHQP